MNELKKARIFWTHGEQEDSVVIEGYSYEELRRQAQQIIDERKPDNYWSEMIAG